MDGVVAVIPARGGSKGVPAKNLQKVGGMTLVGRGIRACREAGIEHIIVSSDDPAILEEARRHGAEPLVRPSQISDDQASTEAALLHAVEAMRRAPRILVLVQCTSPFLAPADVRGVVERVEAGADTAFTAYPSHAFLWRDGQDGAVGINHDASGRARRQNIDPQFVESGGAYAMRGSGFQKAQHRFFGKVAIQPVDPGTGLEIDTPADLRLARAWSAARLELPPPPEGLRAVVFDFDGVMTDDGVFVDERAREAVRCDRSDGLGLEMLRSAGIPALVISKETNPVVAARCRKLDLPCIRGEDDKATALQQWLSGNSLPAQDVAFVGNDVNDLPCLGMVGHAVAVADAHPDVLAAADWTTRSRGGHGAVREVCQWVLSALAGES